MMDELRNGKFKLKGIGDSNASVEERTSATGKSAGHVISGVHATFSLP